MLTSSVLARQLAKLPSSLQKAVLWLEHCSINDQRSQPTSFLVEGVDTFSTSFHYFSSRLPHLTELYLNANHISPFLLWPPDTICSLSTPLWPNLSIFDIRTNFETAEGAYWMRSRSDYPENTEHLDYYWGDRPATEDGSTVPGSWPVLYFRVRPEPVLFDALAISIARAVSHMPKLAYLNLEFNAHHRGPNNGGIYQHFKNYQGWACYFREKNSIRFASTCFANEWPHPGPDYTDIERPRLEWVFQCPFREVQWRQPQEADELWRKTFPDVDFDLITLDYKSGKWFDTWERRREGRVICRSRLR